MAQAYYPPCSSPFSSALFDHNHITTRISFSTSSFLNLRKLKTFLQPTFSSSLDPIPQLLEAINSVEDAKLEDPDAKSSPLLKTRIGVVNHTRQPYRKNPNSIPFLVKLAKSLDSSSHPISEQHVYETLKASLGENNVRLSDAEHILHNIMNPKTAIFALKYFQQKILPDSQVTLYNVIFKLFVEIKDFENAEKLFDKMLQRGITPNLFTMFTLIRCATVCSFPRKAVELFERMPFFGIEPDHKVFTWMISVYAHIGNVHMATSLYDRAKKEKWHIKTAAFSMLIMLYGKLKNYDACLSLYNDMKVLGTPPSMLTYNGLLYAMGKTKRGREAKAIYKEMKENGFSPTWTTYSGLLEAYSRARWSQDALSVYEEMKKKGMILNKFLCGMLLDMCADIGYIDEAVEIFEDMKRSETETCQPDSFIYTSLINMYLRRGKISEAEAMMNEMLSCGFEPNVFVLTMFVYYYGKAKQTDDVVKIFNQFWDSGISPDDRLCDCLLNVLIQIPKQEHGKITDCIVKANPKLWCVVRYLMEERKGDGDFRNAASELFNSVDHDVKKKICNSLIDLCVNLGVHDRARDLLDLGLTFGIYKDIESRSETQWSLHLKKLSVGAAMTVLHVWIDDLSKAFESGEEVPPQLGICTGPHYKLSDKELATHYISEGT